jgi:hypothetical protein
MASRRQTEGLIPTATDWLRAAELIEARAQGDADTAATLITDAMDSTPPRLVALLQAVLNLAPVDATRAADVRRRIEAGVFADLLDRL